MQDVRPGFVSSQFQSDRLPEVRLIPRRQDFSPRFLILPHFVAKDYIDVILLNEMLRSRGSSYHSFKENDDALDHRSYFLGDH